LKSKADVTVKDSAYTTVCFGKGAEGSSITFADKTAENAIGTNVENWSSGDVNANFSDGTAEQLVNGGGSIMGWWYEGDSD
jgi:hypothetical protein